MVLQGLYACYMNSQQVNALIGSCRKRSHMPSNDASFALL